MLSTSRGIQLVKALEEIPGQLESVLVQNETIKKIASRVDDVIYLPQTLDPLYPLLTVVPLQLLAYHIAVARGCDVDKPRNLAKSVIVE